MKRGTVISGADPTYKRRIFDFAKAHSNTNELSLIIQPGIEAALASPSATNLCSMQRFTQLDILRSRAERSWRHGSRTCIIVACVACNKGFPGFQECIEFVVREKIAIESWKFFDEFYMACFTPNTSLVPITPAEYRP